jgi:hypothetical protein
MTTPVAVEKAVACFASGESEHPVARLLKASAIAAMSTHADKRTLGPTKQDAPMRGGDTLHRMSPWDTRIRRLST